MDSYRYPDDAELTYMVKTFGCQAALGLEYGAPIGPNFREHLAGNQVNAALSLPVSNLACSQSRPVCLHRTMCLACLAQPQHDVWTVVAQELTLKVAVAIVLSWPAF
jgi:hypothetical protein